MDRKFGKRIWCLQESQNISNTICIDGYFSFGETGASTCILVPTELGRCVLGVERGLNSCAVLLRGGIGIVCSYLADSGKPMEAFVLSINDL